MKFSYLLLVIPQFIEGENRAQAQHTDEEKEDIDSEEVEPVDLEGLVAGYGNSTNEEWENGKEDFSDLKYTSIHL